MGDNGCTLRDIRSPKFPILITSCMLMVGNRDEFGKGTRQNFCSYPLPLMFDCTCISKFSDTFEICSFNSNKLFRKIPPKFPKNQNFFQIFQNWREKYYLSTKISPKSLYLLKVGRSLPQKVQIIRPSFSSKHSFFIIFGVFGAKNL